MKKINYRKFSWNISLKCGCDIFYTDICQYLVYWPRDPSCSLYAYWLHPKKRQSWQFKILVYGWMERLCLLNRIIEGITFEIQLIVSCFKWGTTSMWPRSCRTQMSLWDLPGYRSNEQMELTTATVNWAGWKKNYWHKWCWEEPLDFSFYVRDLRVIKM